MPRVTANASCLQPEMSSTKASQETATAFGFPDDPEVNRTVVMSGCFSFCLPLASRNGDPRASKGSGSTTSDSDVLAPLPTPAFIQSQKDPDGCKDSAALLPRIESVPQKLEAASMTTKNFSKGKVDRDIISCTHHRFCSFLASE